MVQPMLRMPVTVTVTVTVTILFLIVRLLCTIHADLHLQASRADRKQAADQI